MLRGGGYFAGHETPSGSSFGHLALFLELVFEDHKILKEKTDTSLRYICVSGASVGGGTSMAWQWLGSLAKRNKPDRKSFLNQVAQAS